tara:strand:+ start:393 stop:641 length:249 start_codon:yes stop_codon:yes gene_type:complete
MLTIAQLVEHHLVTVRVAGSNPVGHPIYARVAQLVRALVLHARCRKFESYLEYHFLAPLVELVIQQAATLFISIQVQGGAPF